MNTEVKAVVATIAEPWRLSLKQQFGAFYRRVVAEYRAECVRCPLAHGSPHHLYPRPSGMARSLYKAAENKIQRINGLRVLDSKPRSFAEYHADRSSQHVYTLKADWEAIVDARAEKEADYAVEGFITKITNKLTGIVDAAGGLKAHNTSGMLREGAIWLTCHNGLQFQISNSIVWACNENGTIFCRYPTTFHAVILPGGERLKQPSEAKLKLALIAEEKGELANDQGNPD